MNYKKFLKISCTEIALFAAPGCWCCFKKSLKCWIFLFYLIDLLLFSQNPKFSSQYEAYSLIYKTFLKTSCTGIALFAGPGFWSFFKKSLKCWICWFYLIDLLLFSQNPKFSSQYKAYFLNYKTFLENSCTEIALFAGPGFWSFLEKS